MVPKSKGYGAQSTKRESKRLAKFIREMIAKDLKEYCGLDTDAMYAIGKHLDELGSRGHKVTTTRSAHAGVAIRSKGRSDLMFSGRK